MGKLAFDNQDVAAKYESDFAGDPKVHLPGKNGTGFACKLSKINLEQADKLFKSPGQNLIRLKPGVVDTKDLLAKTKPEDKTKEKS